MKNQNNQLKIYLTDEEKEIYIVDLEPFRDLQWLLSNATNNINQIAKAPNTTGVIYKKDIDYMREKIEKLSREIWNIHSLLLNRSKESSGD
ncbi:plasmid mobilization relaxosome protein MobC [Aerococcus christensenii]|nr:plasmid mobilization relaxosome protein MobC [Aerococcus christensenii]WEB71734.1 plasmid mobilization relaxosome protein MobC [Aerococcus christensenii]